MRSNGFIRWLSPLTMALGVLAGIMAPWVTTGFVWPNLAPTSRQRGPKYYGKRLWDHAVPPYDGSSRDNSGHYWGALGAHLTSEAESSSSIETGSLVVSLVEDRLGCHDLRQPYLHKAVILILEHDPQEFTQGILLNRPTNVVLMDDDIVYDGERDGSVTSSSSNCNNNLAWPMHFGGDLAGFFDDTRHAMICCLYQDRNRNSNNNNSISHHHKASDLVLQDLHVTSHAAARDMIQQQQQQTQNVTATTTTVDDFFAFYGFCGWEPGQLQREIARGSWTVVAPSADAIVAQLQRQRRQDDPRRAGLAMWEYYSSRHYDIGQGDLDGNTNMTHQAFSDLMLKAWAEEYLCLARKDDEDGDDYMQPNLQALTASFNVAAGDVYRASDTHYLLQEQYLHKAVVLLLQEEEDEASVGLVLNLPTVNTYRLTTEQGAQVEFTIRYGGSSGKRGQEPLLWLHCSRALRKLGIGTPLSRSSPICLCTIDEVSEAIDLDLTLSQKFLLVQGFTAWDKFQGDAGGMRGETRAGHMHKVLPQQIDNVWSVLQSQRHLTDKTLEHNLQMTCSAWTCGGLDGDAINDGKVFSTNVSKADLADEALGLWMDIFLLGDAEYVPTR